MKIYIPSRGRAEQANHTLHHLPEAWRCKTQFVVHADEATAYRKRFGKDRVMSTKLTGIGNVRQRIIDISDGPVLMLDDDLRFFKRRADDPTKFAKATPGEVSKMLQLAQNLLEGRAHISIAAREGANRNTERFLHNTRMLRALGYDAAVLKKEKIRFDRCPVMEDFDVALQLLERGYGSTTINYYVQDQTTSNAPGGCSEYRTAEVQAAGARRLHELHPDYVKVVAKQTKGAWGGGERTDVIVSWKKAYNHGV